MPHTDDTEYSSDKQRNFAHLTIAVTALSFITALEATALFFFPLSAPIILPIATAVEVAVTLAILVLLATYLAGTYKPDMAPDEIAKVDIASQDHTPYPAPQNSLQPTARLYHSSPLAPPKMAPINQNEMHPSP